MIMSMKIRIFSLAAGLALALTGSLSARDNYKDTWYVNDHLATTDNVRNLAHIF
ncbi:hypothetical protein OpiT1DRAFT_00432 [Opitutaceae bacterium TAV1]|nr:hypothetical protein OpiT1DRAFT_00432 [Opitutaceae bacterium TAV1]